jgi:regulatory protein
MPFKKTTPREPSAEPALFEYAVKSLSVRMRTERDLRRLLKPRAHPGEPGQRDIDAVIRRLTDLKYLSDTRYAADYTRLRKENQGFGRRRVQQDLAQKGIAKDTAADALATAYDDSDELALARAYIERKRIQKPKDQKETVRIVNRLLRAGYAPGPIFKLLRAWQIPEEAIPAEPGADSDSYAEPEQASEE